MSLIKNVGLLNYFKIRKNAPTCFGLKGNHHQGATASTQLKLHTWFKVCCAHTPHRSQYAAITLTTSCTSSTYPLLTNCVILAKY